MRAKVVVNVCKNRRVQTYSNRGALLVRKLRIKEVQLCELQGVARDYVKGASSIDDLPLNLVVYQTATSADPALCRALGYRAHRGKLECIVIQIEILIERPYLQATLVSKQLDKLVQKGAREVNIDLAFKIVRAKLRVQVGGTLGEQLVKEQASKRAHIGKEGEYTKSLSIS